MNQQKKKPNVIPGKSMSREDLLLSSTREISPQPGPSNVDTPTVQPRRRGRLKLQPTTSSPRSEPSNIDIPNIQRGRRGRPKKRPPTQTPVIPRRNARRNFHTNPMIESDNSEPFPASDSD